MVVRVWKGWGGAEGVERYCREHFARFVLPQLERVDGFAGATVLVRAADGRTEVVVATEWASLDAVRAFAGDDYERAVVEPAVSALLEGFDERVRHFEVAARAGRAGGRAVR